MKGKFPFGPLKFDLSKLKKIKKDQLLIVFLVGVLLLVIALPVDNKKNNNDNDEDFSPKESEDTSQNYKDLSNDEYQKTLEQRLQEVLESMDGVGKAQVMITLKDTGESIVEKDTSKNEKNTQEEDTTGGKREVKELDLKESTVFTQEDTNQSTPFITKEINPKVEGVLIVAQGGGDAKIIKNISDAVLALFPIEAHKIMVVKMNQ